MRAASSSPGEPVEPGCPVFFDRDSVEPGVEEVIDKLEEKIPQRARNRPRVGRPNAHVTFVESLKVSNSHAPQRGGDETIRETCS